jgi:hypothetical protein
MHIVADPALKVATLAGRKNRANKDGMEKPAIEFLRANPNMSLRETARALKDVGIARSKDWVMDKRYELLQENGGKLRGGS